MVLGKGREDDDSGLLRLIRKDIKRTHDLTSIADLLKCVYTGQGTWGSGK